MVRHGEGITAGADFGITLPDGSTHPAEFVSRNPGWRGSVAVHPPGGDEFHHSGLFPLGMPDSAPFTIFCI